MTRSIIGPAQRWTAWLAVLPRSRKRLLMVAADVVCIPAALLTAVWLKQGTAPDAYGPEPWLYLAALCTSLPVFVKLGLYRAVMRFVGSKVVGVVFAGVTVSVLVLVGINELFSTEALPWETFAIYWAVALVYVGGSRLLVRHVLYARKPGAARVVIYGAGTAGAQVANALRSGGRFEPVAFLDDDPSLQEHAWSRGSGSSAPRICRSSSSPGTSTSCCSRCHRNRRQRRQLIIKRIEPLPVRVMTVPDISDLLAGEAQVEDLRDVDVGDLLGRDPVSPNEYLFDACIRDKVVMVTGAGGSIGSELCRQILRNGPRRLVLLEMSELALYSIERELARQMKHDGRYVELTGLLGNAHHKYRVREIIQSYEVQTIYHAAAYKHVPIVEHNVIEGIHNNVISTWYTGEAALECGVETFVLISTDKAVNPTNVMGATKRLAEMVLQGLHHRGSRTRFCMVRFGNVLESSGSVVPLFRDQIRRGGPVTVTHPDVTRYFMTIPEAVQLVLQAGAMAQGGDVFVLDMGKPIRIAELARRMIKLSGFTVRDEGNPQGDIAIEFTGLRPAEKMFEELLIGKNVAGTEHPMILRAVEHSLPWDEIQLMLHDLLVAMGQFDVPGARRLLISAVREYQPGPEEIDLVWKRRDILRVPASKVTNIDSRRLRGRREVGPVPD